VPGFVARPRADRGGKFRPGPPQRRGRAQLCISLLDRDRPATEESLLGAGALLLAHAETCIRTDANSEAVFIYFKCLGLFPPP